MLSRTKRYLVDMREHDDLDHPIHGQALELIGLADMIYELAEEGMEDQPHYYGRMPSPSDVTDFVNVAYERALQAVMKHGLNMVVRDIAAHCESYEDIQTILDDMKEESKRLAAYNADLGDLDDHPF